MDRLPVEIIDTIISHCDFGSLKALRATCKGFSRTTLSSQIFQTIYMAKSKSKLEDTRNISEHPLLSGLVKELIFEGSQINVLSYSRWQSFYARATYSEEQHYNVAPPRELSENKYAEYRKVSHEAKDWNITYAGAEFARLVAKLPNLERMSYCVHHPNRNPIWRNLRDRASWNGTLFTVWRIYDGAAVDSFFEGLVARATQTSFKPIRHLELGLKDLRIFTQDDDEAYDWADKVQRVRSTVEHVMPFLTHLAVVVDKIEADRNKGADLADYSPAAFPAFVKAAKNLNCLTVAYAHEYAAVRDGPHAHDPPRTNPYDLLGGQDWRSVVLPRLKSLHLSIPTTKDSLVSFVQAHKSTLQVLQLAETSLLPENGTWKEAFVELAEHLNINNFTFERLEDGDSTILTLCKDPLFHEELSDFMTGRDRCPPMDATEWMKLHPSPENANSNDQANDEAAIEIPESSGANLSHNEESFNTSVATPFSTRR